MDIAAKLRDQLNRENRPKAHIANEAGMSRFSLWHFQHGNSGLSLDRASRLASVLGFKLTKRK